MPLAEATFKITPLDLERVRIFHLLMFKLMEQHINMYNTDKNAYNVPYICSIFTILTAQIYPF